MKYLTALEVIVWFSIILLLAGTEGCKREPSGNGVAEMSPLELQVRKSISDDVLNELVRQHVSESRLKELCGNPISGAEGVIKILNFDLTIPYLFMRKTPGRVGFTAVLKDEKLTEWHEIWMGGGYSGP